MRSIPPTTALLLTLLMAARPLAAGELLGAEPFDGYLVGSIVGQAADTPMLRGAWAADQPTQGFKVEEESLTYRDLATSGGRLVVEPTGRTLNVDLNTAADGPLAPRVDQGRLGVVNQPVYVSFLCRAHGTEVRGSQGWIGLAGDGVEYSFGQVWEQSTFSNTKGKPSDVPLDTQTHLVVLKVGVYAWGNQVDVYLDPELGQPESSQTVDLQGWPGGKDAPLSVEQLRFKANGNAWSFDEVRVGTTFESVLPLTVEP